MADFHRDVLANAGAKIIFRTNYPESRTTAGFLRGNDGQDLSQQLEQLAVGCAYVSVPRPRARPEGLHVLGLRRRRGARRPAARPVRAVVGSWLRPVGSFEISRNLRWAGRLVPF